MVLSLVYQSPHTVKSLLKETEEYIAPSCPETPRLDAEVLLAEALHIDKAGLYRSFNEIVPAQVRKILHKMVERRVRGEPVSYILGRKEFWSLPFSVGPAVMVPRPDTELLVECARELFPRNSSPALLDLGTGSGAVAIALAKELPAASITAIDISAEALVIARKNAVNNGISFITFLHGNLFEPVSHGAAFDLIVSNPPYIPTERISALPKGLRDYEPHTAFDGGLDGLDFYRSITTQAPTHLKSGGFLLFEVGFDQSDTVKKIITENGHFDPPEAVRDLSGYERVIKARLREHYHASRKPRSHP